MNWFEGWLKGELDNFWTAYKDDLAERHRRVFENLLNGKMSLIEALDELIKIERELIEIGALDRLEYVNKHLVVLVSRLKEEEQVKKKE